MANEVLNLAPDIYGALDVVSRELVGIIPSVARDSRADRVAKGTNFRSPVTPVNATINNTVPQMADPNDETEQTIANVAINLQYYWDNGFAWNGEDQYSVSTGPGFSNIIQDQFAQCFRAHANAVESQLATLIADGASRAAGTPGTTPFGPGGNLGACANVRRVLDDNGAPGGQTPGARTLVVNTTCGAGLRSMDVLTKVNEAGTNDTLRKGTILNVHGFDIKESAGIQPVTAIGTAAGATTNSAGYAKGATVITLAAAGTGTILAGDIITFAGDTTDKTHQYVVAVGNASVAAGGTITLQAPGLMQAIPALAKAVTVLAIATPNLAFTRNAVLLASRLQKVPEKGDKATDRMTVTDPVSGLVFEVAYYPGYRMGTYKVFFAWGATVMKPEHIGLLLG